MEGALVTNIGDVLSYWTQKRYQSTVHRVIHQATTQRVSIPFFFEPNFDASLIPLTEMKNPKAKSLDPTFYGEHLFNKISNNFINLSSIKNI